MKAFGEGKNVKFNKVCESFEKIQRPLQTNKVKSACFNRSKECGRD